MDEYILEKAQVQGVVDKIAEEDAMEAAARHQKQTETRAMLKQFVVEQEEKRREMERQEQEEADRIEEYARKKREFEERLAAEKEAMEAEKKRVLGEMIGKQMEKNR